MALLLFSACFGLGSPDHGPQHGRKAAHAVKPAPAANVATTMPTSVRSFLKQNCALCHNKQTMSGGLDFAATRFHLDDANNFAFWVKVHDRVEKGEMPPKGMPRPPSAARSAFLAALGRPLDVVQDARTRRDGRAVWRRMNRYEYENTLRDLLGAPWLQIKEMLPEDGLAFRFNKVGEALDVSHVQMSRYLSAADYALRQAMASLPSRPATTTRRYYTRQQRSFVGLAKAGFAYVGATARATFPIVGNSADIPALMGTGPMTVGNTDPARREIEGMGVVASAYEPTQPKFNQFHAPVSGRYKLRLCGHSFWAGPDNEKRWWVASQKDISAGRTTEPVSLYAFSPPETLRKLGSFDIGPDTTVRELDVYLLKGETIMPDAVRLFRSRPPSWHTPLAEKDGQPGVCFNWLEVTGPILDQWPPRGEQLLFGDLPMKEGADGHVEVLSTNPNADADRLVPAFMRRALRRPVQEADVQPFVKLAHTALASGASFTDAMIATYSAVLCSPEFVTLEERPGALDDWALASRLSYFLWNSEPDDTLRALAARKELHNPAVLDAQTDRMLADPRAAQFVDAFLDYWLDLRKANDVSPDADLYPDYYLDDFLTESSVDETRAFFTELIGKNLPARNLIDSDFVMINGRLARLYDIPGVQGAAIRRVELPKDSVRGGLLTQASVLKVTANGTTTSPVQRGVWITERILGQPVHPPPPNLPVIDPDTRGATTIREQLEKHRTQPTCRACHANIDPPGFALESFDVFGGFRDHYRALGPGAHVPGFGKNGQPFEFREAKPVDCTGTLPDGRSFKDVRDLKRLLLKDERGIARNVVRQLLTYSTGAPERFADRPQVEAILDRAKPGGYGVRSLIHGIVESALFREK